MSLEVSGMNSLIAVKVDGEYQQREYKNILYVGTRIVLQEPIVEDNEHLTFNMQTNEHEIITMWR